MKTFDKTSHLGHVIYYLSVHDIFHERVTVFRKWILAAVWSVLHQLSKLRLISRFCQLVPCSIFILLKTGNQAQECLLLWKVSLIYRIILASVYSALLSVLSDLKRSNSCQEVSRSLIICHPISPSPYPCPSPSTCGCYRLSRSRGWCFFYSERIAPYTMCSEKLHRVGKPRAHGCADSYRQTTTSELWLDSDHIRPLALLTVPLLIWQATNNSDLAH